MDGTITGNVVLSTTANGMTADAGNFTLTNGAGTTSGVIDFAADAEASDIAAAINTVGNSLGVTATATNSATLSALNAAGTISFNLEGTAVSAVISDANNLTALVTAVNGVSGTTGITASFTTVGATDSITLSTTDGRDIAIDTFADADGAVTNTISFNGSTMTEGAATADAVKVGTIALSSTTGAITLNNSVAEFTAASNSSFDSVSTVDITSASGATSALAVVDAAIDSVNAGRADLGAFQNRFESVVASLQIA